MLVIYANKNVLSIKNFTSYHPLLYINCEVQYIMAKKITYALELELTEIQVRSLCDSVPGKQSEAWKLSGLALAALQDLADGGMLLGGQATKRIVDLVQPLESDQDLVRAVEAGVAQDQGRFVGKWYVDPTYVPVLQEMAANQGLSVEQVTTALMDWGVGQGWAYQMAPSTVVVFMDRLDWIEASHILGKDQMTGTDLADFVRVMGRPATQQEMQAGIEALGAEPAPVKK